MCTHIDACSNITNHAQTRVHTDTHTHSRTHTHTQTCRKPDHDYDCAKNDLIELFFIFMYIYVCMGNTTFDAAELWMPHRCFVTNSLMLFD